MVEFSILGPVQVVRDGHVLELGGPRRRAVLALLLVAGGLVVPAEQLAEELWGGSPPPGAGGNAACARVTAARAAEPGRRPGGGGWRLPAGGACGRGAGRGPVTAADAVGRAERLLQEAAGDPWAEVAILQPLIMLYCFAGRLDDARAAWRRARSTLTAAGAELDLAICAKLAGRTELIAGEPAEEEQIMRQGYETLAAMGERGHRGSLATWLAEALYEQGRDDQALRLTEEAEALAGPDDCEVQGRWRATRAKLLARRGQFDTAVRLAGEAVSLIPATFDPPERAEFLLAKAEVARLHGALDDAEACTRQALEFYEQRQMVPQAEQARALLASLAAQG